MRDLVAALLALFLLAVAIALIASLRYHQRRRAASRGAEAARGRTIVAELPLGADLVLFSEDARSFHLGDREIEKAGLQAVRVLVNGSPIAAYVSSRFPGAERRPPTSFDDRPDGIARDRWDVALETPTGSVLVECGAIRERISQELARRIYEAVRRDLERRDAASPPARGG